MRAVTGGTDTHLALIDLQNIGVTGKDAEARSDAAGIVLNKNAIPNKPDAERFTSGDPGRLAVGDHPGDDRTADGPDRPVDPGRSPLAGRRRRRTTRASTGPSGPRSANWSLLYPAYPHRLSPGGGAEGASVPRIRTGRPDRGDRRRTCAPRWPGWSPPGGARWPNPGTGTCTRWTPHGWAVPRCWPASARPAGGARAAHPARPPSATATR